MVEILSSMILTPLMCSALNPDGPGLAPKTLRVGPVKLMPQLLLSVILYNISGKERARSASNLH